MSDTTDDFWEELDALCEDLRAGPTDDGDEPRARLREQLELFKPALALLDQHMRDLAPERAMAQLRDRFLGGAGIVQHTSLEFGLERMTALWWQAAVDPRQDLAAAGGMYRIEVWIGLNEHGRARVRVIGAKRLEATLPVTREKFRAVLIGALRAPAVISEGEDTAAGEPHADAEPADTRPSSGIEDQNRSVAEDTPIAMGPAAPAPDTGSGATEAP